MPSNAQSTLMCFLQVRLFLTLLVAPLAASAKHSIIQARNQPKANFLEIQVNQHGIDVPPASLSLTQAKQAGNGTEHFAGAAHEAPSARSGATPGLLSTSAFACLAFASFLGVRAWENVFPSADKETDDSEFDKEEFALLSDAGELDFYTCMALSTGEQRTVKSIVHFLPQLVILLALQIGVGVMLVIYQMDNQHFLPATQGSAYRLIGTTLFAYSAFNVYHSMYDDCREMIVEKMFQQHLSGWYAWPILFGEIMNLFVGSILMVILFLIFCDCTRPQDLLINCIAINFLADVDNTLTGPHEGIKANKHLESFQAELLKAPAEASIVSPHSLNYSLLHMQRIVRRFVPVLGGVLTFLFFFGHDDTMCQHMRQFDPWPFCYGVQ